MTPERPFGVEIECYAPFLGECRRTVDEVDSFLWEENFKLWSVGEDESLSELGVEIKSPILRGASGFKSLKRMMTFLTENDFWVDETCGFHVHYSAPEFINSPDMVTSLVRSWMDNQQLIDMMVAPWRIDNGHCSPWSEVDYSELLDNIDYGCGYDSARGAINVNPLEFYGTIEIRQHEGTLDYEDASSWVKFGHAFIDNIGRTALEKSPDEESFMRRIKVSKNAHRFISKKVEANKGNLARNSFIY